MPVRSAVTIALLAVALAATGVLAQAEASPPVSTVPTTPGPNPSGDTTTDRDAWFAAGTELVRLSGEDGSVIERQDVGDTDCPPSYGWRIVPLRFDGALWLDGVDSMKRNATACVLKVPLDGSEPSVFWLSPRPKRALVPSYYRAIAPTTTGDLYAVAADVPASKRAGYSLDQQNLYRLSTDRDAPASLVQKHVVLVAPSNASPVGLYAVKDKQGRLRQRLGILDGAAGRFRSAAWIGRVAKAAYWRSLEPGPGGLVGGSGMSDGAIVIDVGAQVVETVRSTKKGTSVISVLPTPKGTWVTASVKTGVRLEWVPDDGAKPVVVDPCAGSGLGKQCMWTSVGWTDDATWFMVVPVDRKTGAWDMDLAVFRRYRIGETTASLDVPRTRLLEVNDVPGAVDTEPTESSPSPDLAIDVAVAATPAPEAVHPVQETMTRRQLVKQLVGQKDSQIRKVSYSELQATIKELWDKFGDQLEAWDQTGYGQTLKRSDLMSTLRGMRDGVSKSNKYNEIWLDRVVASESMTWTAIEMYRWADSDALRRRARRLAQLAYAYGVTQPLSLGKLDRAGNRRHIDADLEYFLSL